ncbi:hypothetical protein QOZ80_1AG0040580 [Eleusine coracana subsp. coracana]|nr:hypothetical protein QOZ80_1AG0040580 [Eleusine coracana subsp. coracana]
MDAPPPTQPVAAAAAAAAPSTTSASAPSPAPPPNPPTSAAATVSTTVTATPNTGTAANPAQTLEPPAPSPAAARPPAPRMRPPYTHLASPITMSSSSSPATSGASSSSAPAPASSTPASVTPRGGVVIGVPTPRPAQTPIGYTGFVPPPPLSHQFGSMHRGPDQSPPSSAQFRPPSPVIQNIGVVGALSTSQMRPGATSGPQQPRPGLPSSTTPVSSGIQMPGSQRPPAHALTRPMSQAARTPVSMAQKPDTPATPNVAVMRSVDLAKTDTDASENGNRLLTKRSIHELVAQIDPNEKLDPEVEDVLIDIAEDFVESIVPYACALAKHRKSDTLEAKDVLLHAEKSWNITLPGFSGDEIKLYKKQHVNDIHRERLTLIKKSMASENKASAAQATANQKNQTPKPPAPTSP